MRARVDLENKTITAAISDLVESPRDSARSVGVVPTLRAELGQEVHRRYRQAREESTEADRFSAEVAVSMTREVDGFTATIRGRIDGLIDRGDQLVVEEVKSVTMAGSELFRVRAAAMPDYCLQLCLYGLCLAEDGRGSAISTRLVLVSVLDDSQRTVDVPFDVEEARADLDRLLRAALDEARAIAKRAARRAEWAEKLAFPYPAMRPHQRELIAELDAGLAGGSPVLAMAPTGIGKTISALLAGLRFALRHDCVVYFLTAKTTQQALVARTFLDLAASSGLAPGSLSALTLRAKERMCPPGHLLCHPDLCPHLRDFSRRAQASGVVEKLLRDNLHVSPDAVYEAGEDRELCPFELSMQIAARVELVIGDYNYVYDHSAALGSFADDSRKSPAVIIIDEAHNLFDRARGYDSPFLGRHALVQARKRLRAGAYGGGHRSGRNSRTRTKAEKRSQLDLLGMAPADSGLAGELEHFCTQLCHYIDTTLDDALASGHNFVGGATLIERDDEFWHGCAEKAGRLMLGLFFLSRSNGLSLARDPLMEILRTALRMRDTVCADEDELLPYVAGPGAEGGKGVGVLCVNPARRLMRRHKRVRGTLAMSATLTPMSYFSDVLGFADLEPHTITAPSPFPKQNRQVVLVPTVTTTYRQRDRHIAAIARLIAEIIAVRPGRYLAFFPSFAFLTRVRDELAAPDVEILVQLPSMPQALRRQTIERFTTSDGPALLLAVTGGIFAEGIDLPGDALIGAIVVGPSLPPVGFERTVMRRYFNERGEQGFAYAMLYPGMQRVIQSAGRVIRTMDDKGVIALLGSRFIETGYAECLPPDWYRRRVAELVTRDPAGTLAAFWRAADASPS